MSATTLAPPRPAPGPSPSAAAETAPRNAGIPRHVLALMALSVVIRVVFWLTTQRVWEDALITLAAVRNAFTPIGLTHHGGEGRVFSFTSPISVLVPLAGEAVQRGSGLLALRLASLVCAPIAVYFTWRICRRLGISTWPAVFAMTYVAADHEQVLFGMAGMETQMATTILLGSVYAVMAENDLGAGISFGLALLARPDFVLWVVPALAYTWWRRGAARAARGVALAAAVYGPWLLFTGLYYGTIIPQTIRAKAVVFSPIRLILGSGHLGPLDWLGNALHLYGTEVGMFSPLYETSDISRAPVPLALGLAISMFIVILAIQGAWRTRAVPGWLPAIAYTGLFFVYMVLFLGAASTFGWYMPPFRAMVVILAAAGMMRLGQVFPRVAPLVAGGLAVGFVAGSLVLFPIDGQIQQLEEGVRIQVGHYLADHGPDQTVVTESSGYVGYYSRSRLYDFPGLTSAVSYHTLASAPPQDRSLLYLVVALKPQWIVMRPGEFGALKARYPAEAAHYSVAARFRSDIPLAAFGVGLDSIDREFYVLKRG